MYEDQKQISGCLWMGAECYKEGGETFGVTGMFTA